MKEDAVEIDLAHLAIFSRFMAWLNLKDKGQAPNADALETFQILTGKDSTSPVYYLFEGYVAGYAAALKEEKSRTADRDNGKAEPEPEASSGTQAAQPLPEKTDYFQAYRNAQKTRD